MIYSRFMLLALGLPWSQCQHEGRVGRMDGRRRNDQSASPCLSLAFPAPAYARTYRLWQTLSICTYRTTFISAISPLPLTGTGSPFVSTDSGLSFASTGTGPTFAHTPIDTAGLYALGYRYAPPPLPSQRGLQVPYPHSV